MDGWGTHFPILAACVSRTIGPILELGCGDYSTFMLHLLCSGKRRLVSVESNKEWIEKYTDLKSKNHEFHLVQSYDDLKLIDEVLWDVVLIDHAPVERRIIDIQRLKDRAVFMVVHDTESPAYCYERVLPSFRFRFDYKRLNPWTTVVSNFKEFIL